MSLLDVQTVPRMFKVRQEFPRPEPLDISATVVAQIASVQDLLKPNARVAVTVGSRGIANLREIVRTVLDALKAAGVQPFILPAMGSHGQPAVAVMVDGKPWLAMGQLFFVSWQL